MTIQSAIEEFLVEQQVRGNSPRTVQGYLQKLNPEFEYIVAMEPQGRGAWHAHLLLLYFSEAPFIPNAILREIWGNGYVQIGKLSDVDNVGAYLTAYLSDMELSEENEILSGKKIKVVNDKRYVKGARLRLYPPKFNLYRCSRGIKRPVVEHIAEAEAMQKVGAATPTFERTIELSDPETGFSIVISKRYYNRNCKKGQVLDYDASNGNRGISCGTTGAGQQSADGAGVSSKVEDVHALHWCRAYRRDFPFPVQAILYPSDEQGQHICYRANIRKSLACLPHLVL